MRRTAVTLVDCEVLVELGAGLTGVLRRAVPLSLGEFLRQQRDKRKLKRRDIGSMYDVSDGQVAHWEQDVNVPRYEVLKQLVEFYGYALERHGAAVWEVRRGRSLGKDEKTALCTVRYGGLACTDDGEVKHPLFGEDARSGSMLRTCSLSSTCGMVCTYSGTYEPDIHRGEAVKLECPHGFWGAESVEVEGMRACDACGEDTGVPKDECRAGGHCLCPECGDRFESESAR